MSIFYMGLEENEEKKHHAPDDNNIAQWRPWNPNRSLSKCNLTLHQALPPTLRGYTHFHSSTRMLHKVRLLAQKPSSSSGSLCRGRQLSSRSEGKSNQISELTLSKCLDGVAGQKSKLATSWKHLDLPFHSSLHLGPPRLGIGGETRAQTTLPIVKMATVHSLPTVDTVWSPW